MDILLDNVEVRILGCLIEKEISTPEYYPLSLNALINACNQKSNRRPLLSVDEGAVSKGLEGLSQKGLARETHAAGSRVPKYLHELLSRFDLSGHELAVLCELMLRGPQTPGELRSNAGRMAHFANIEEVEEVLKALTEHEPPLVARLPKEAGRKESRYAHLFSPQDAQVVLYPDAGLTPRGQALNEPLRRMEEEIARIRNELEELREAFEKFKSQF